MYYTSVWANTCIVHMNMETHKITLICPHMFEKVVGGSRKNSAPLPFDTSRFSSYVSWVTMMMSPVTGSTACYDRVFVWRRHVPAYFCILRTCQRLWKRLTVHVPFTVTWTESVFKCIWKQFFSLFCTNFLHPYWYTTTTRRGSDIFWWAFGAATLFDISSKESWSRREKWAERTKWKRITWL